jgi:hypothetical protein
MHRMVSALPLSYSPPLATRLKIIREREDAWKRLEWTCRSTLQFSSRWYDFVGGVYGNGSDQQDIFIKSIDFFKLPSANPPSEDIRTWSHSMVVGLNFIDFTMDPAQDLLVLVEVAPRPYVWLHIFKYVGR